jgi:predicted kinase
VKRLIVVIFGLMGVGKSTLARALGEARSWPVIHSDTVRKTLAGLDPTTHVTVGFGQGIYAENYSGRTYGEMRRLAAISLEKFVGVILDASFKSSRERELVRRLAQEQEARAVFILCTCPPEVVTRRLTGRAGNLHAISDGRAELVLPQAETFDPVTPADTPLLTLDTSGDRGQVLAQVEEFLDRLARGL